MKRSSNVWILVAMFVFLFLGIYFFASPGPGIESKVATTYNPDPRGVKAFYTLLGRLGYSTDRLVQPYTKLPRNAGVLIVVEPHPPMPTSGQPQYASKYYITNAESDALTKWARNGGTVLFFSNKLKGVPKDFMKTRALGKGRIYAFDSSWMITNKGLRNEKNAMTILRIIGPGHGSPGPSTYRPSAFDVRPGHPCPGRGLILFDEYHHGLGQRKPFLASLSRQVKISILVFLTAAIVLCYSKGRRFGTVRNLPKSETLRPGYQFVESVARLYRRARATDLAASILCDSFKQDLCLRLGLPADAARDQIARRLEIDGSPEIGKRVERMLLRLHAAEASGQSQAGQKPSESELVDMAIEIRNLEQELGLGGTHNTL